MTTITCGFLVAIVISMQVVDTTATSVRNYIACGRELWSALDLVCDGKYQGPKKRTELLSTDDDTMFENPSADAYALNFGEHQHSVGNVHNIRMRRAQTIVYAQDLIELCCRNPCTPDTLKQYCAVR